MTNLGRGGATPKPNQIGVDTLLDRGTKRQQQQRRKNKEIGQQQHNNTNNGQGCMRLDNNVEENNLTEKHQPQQQKTTTRGDNYIEDNKNREKEQREGETTATVRHNRVKMRQPVLDLYREKWQTIKNKIKDGQQQKQDRNKVNIDRKTSGNAKETTKKKKKNQTTKQLGQTTTNKKKITREEAIRKKEELIEKIRKKERIKKENENTRDKTTPESIVKYEKDILGDRNKEDLLEKEIEEYKIKVNIRESKLFRAEGTTTTVQTTEINTTTRTKECEEKNRIETTGMRHDNVVNVDRRTQMMTIGKLVKGTTMPGWKRKQQEQYLNKQPDEKEKRTENKVNRIKEMLEKIKSKNLESDRVRKEKIETTKARTNENNTRQQHSSTGARKKDEKEMNKEKKVRMSTNYDGMRVNTNPGRQRNGDEGKDRQQGERSGRKPNTIRDMIDRLEKKEKENEKEKDNKVVRTTEHQQQQLHENVNVVSESSSPVWTGLRLYKTGTSSEWVEQNKGNNIIEKLPGVRTRVYTPDNINIQNSAAHTELMQPGYGGIQTVGTVKLPEGRK